MSTAKKASNVSIDLGEPKEKEHLPSIEKKQVDGHIIEDLGDPSPNVLPGNQSHCLFTIDDGQKDEKPSLKPEGEKVTKKDKTKETDPSKEEEKAAVKVKHPILVRSLPVDGFR